MNILCYYHGHKWRPSFIKLIVEEEEEEDILSLEIVFSYIHLITNKKLKEDFWKFIYVTKYFRPYRDW